MIEMKMSPT